MTIYDKALAPTQHLKNKKWNTVGALRVSGNSEQMV